MNNIIELKISIKNDNRIELSRELNKKNLSLKRYIEYCIRNHNKILKDYYY